LTPQGVKINTESPPWSEIQAVLARGDSRLAAVLADILTPSLPNWRRAVEKHNINVELIAHQPWDPNTPLPWEFIQI